MNKRISAVILSLVITITLCGCPTQPPEDETGLTSSSSGFTNNEPEDSTTLGGMYNPPPDDNFVPYIPLEHDMRDISSMELVKEIKAGWNLGNTLDATGGSGLSSEWSWGNPRTTYSMMMVIKEAGFDSVRVPVSWGKHMDENYIIDPDWLDRVEEVVGYVLANDMYCILNTHHERWLFPNEENEAQNTEQLIAIWEQLSERFADYNEKLIFEGMNEPRWFGAPNEWNGGTAEAWGVVNRLNAAFVETVRASGGNNEIRHLMIVTYAASSERRAMEALEIPENDDKIIVSIHAYTPWAFALNAGGGGKWSATAQGSTTPIIELFENIKELYLDKGIPVILGETGARDKDNLDFRVEWTKYYFTMAREYGVPCYWWDNGSFTGSGEVFGIFNRRELIWRYPEIKDAIMGV
ncbi:MAG: glycoside hydrolase family 5 protein [Oscillospiraceae bacterium]|nr:glycoside hydrolase family 5 protein [Oscillospiraceae bacterium]